jgi:hypothetical protein
MKGEPTENDPYSVSFMIFDKYRKELLEQMTTLVHYAMNTYGIESR